MDAEFQQDAVIVFDEEEIEFYGFIRNHVVMFYFSNYIVVFYFFYLDCSSNVIIFVCY